MTERKQITCDECPYETAISSDFRKHTRRHREGEFSCDYCNMPFMSKGHLTGHLRQVHGRQDFDCDAIRRCDMCPYSSLHASDFIKHVRKHVTTKFNCRYCNYPFLNEKIMGCHVRKCKFSPKREIVETRPATEAKRSKVASKHPAHDKAMCSSRSSREKQVNDRAEKRYKDNKRKDRSSVKQKKKKKNERDKSKSESKQGGKDGKRERTVCDKEKLTITITQRDQQLANKKVNPVKHTSGIRDRDEVVPRSSTKDDIDSDHLLSDESDTSLMSVDDVSVSSSLEDALLGTSELPSEFEAVTIYLPDSVTTMAVKCLNCNFITTNTESIADHIATHENGKFTCSVCKIPFIHNDELDIHIKVVHDKDNRKEPVERNNNSVVVVDVTATTPEVAVRKEHNCIFCDFKTFDFSELKVHIDGHTSSDSANSSKDDMDAFDIDDEIVVGDEIDLESPEGSEPFEVEVVETNEQEQPEIYTATKVDYDSVSSDQGKRVVSANRHSHNFSTEQTISKDGDQAKERESTHEEQIDSKTGDTVKVHPDTTLDSMEDEKENECKSATLDINNVQQDDTTDVPSVVDNNNEKLNKDSIDKKGLGKSKKLYAEVSDESGSNFRCLVCDSDRLFGTRKCIKKHFKKHHKKLRRNVCESCPHCSKPFP